MRRIRTRPKELEPFLIESRIAFFVRRMDSHDVYARVQTVLTNEEAVRRHRLRDELGAVDGVSRLPYRLRGHVLMKIIVATFGSLGDLHPYVAIALALKQRGHRSMVTLPRCTWPCSRRACQPSNRTGPRTPSTPGSPSSTATARPGSRQTWPGSSTTDHRRSSSPSAKPRRRAQSAAATS